MPPELHQDPIVGVPRGGTSSWLQGLEKRRLSECDGSQTIYLVSKGFQHLHSEAVKEGAEQAGREHKALESVLSTALGMRPR